MAKYQEREVSLGVYDAPKVTVRRVDLVFGKIPLDDLRVRPYLRSSRKPKREHEPDETADVIVHCVDHDVLTDGVTWGMSEDIADRPYEWCAECEKLRAEHLPVAAERSAADEAKRDAHAARYPVSQRYKESDTDYAERLAQVKAIAGRRFSQDIEAALAKALSDPKADCPDGGGRRLLAVMISSRYGDLPIGDPPGHIEMWKEDRERHRREMKRWKDEAELEVINAILARRHRLARGAKRAAS
jgi:hypothetical protein